MTVDVCILCSAGSELNVVLGPIHDEMINSILDMSAVVLIGL